MKLISMTSFIEEQEKFIPATEHGSVKDWDRVYVQRTISYCRFLRQPLTLGMFVPVDEEGNVLELPKCFGKAGGWNCGCSEALMQLCTDKTNEYRKSKEKVLFEGFSLGEYSNRTQYIRQLSKYIIINGIIYDDHQDCAPRPTQNTIESILEYMNPELTPSALKQIGL